MNKRSLLTHAPLIILALLASCTTSQPGGTVSANSSPAPAVTDDHGACDQGNGGIRLPNGFCAAVFADNIGHARHLTVTPSGDVFVNTWSRKLTNMTNT